jgi:hypothetical protein
VILKGDRNDYPVEWNVFQLCIRNIAAVRIPSLIIGFLLYLTFDFNAAEDSFSLLPVLKASKTPVRTNAISTSIQGVPGVKMGSRKYIPALKQAADPEKIQAIRPVMIHAQTVREDQLDDMAKWTSCLLFTTCTPISGRRFPSSGGKREK